MVKTTKLAKHNNVTENKNKKNTVTKIVGSETNNYANIPKAPRETYDT